MDNQSRIAMVRVGDAFSGDGAPNTRVKYHLGDHLGSSGIVIGGAAATDDTFVNREEYFPYGETSFGSFGRKRYRFTGKERDEESGLNYHSARYYAPWLARWASCDPAGTVDGANLYSYVTHNPIRKVDLQGTQAELGPNQPQDKPKPGVHLVIVGTDDPKKVAEGGHGHKDPRSFTKRADTLVSQPTVEKFRERLSQGDEVVFIAPSSMGEELSRTLQDVGRRFENPGVRQEAEVLRVGFEFRQVKSKDLASMIKEYENIKSIYYFGHGAKGGPAFDWNDWSFPEPSAFGPQQFARDAVASFV